MTGGSVRTLLAGAPRLAGRLLAVFAFYAAVGQLGLSFGLVRVVASTPGLVLLGAAGALLLLGAAETVTSARPRREAVARAILLGGAGLALAGTPASLVLRDTVTLTVLEGESLGPRDLPGLPELRLGEVTVLPHGPHLLSKTVSVEARREGGAPVRIGLFPPTAIGPWHLSVYRYGFAPAIEWIGADGALRGSGRILLGTIPHAEEEASLVTWSPETNVMMGAGTFPPKLEELVAGGDEHVFLQLEEATIAGHRRDLRDPDAYRWLADGRLVDPVFHLQVFRERTSVFEGRLAAGAAVQFDGGVIAIAPDVAFFVELLATRDPWLTAAAGGLGLCAIGLALVTRNTVTRRLARRR
jgi:hypothetical protein